MTDEDVKTIGEEMRASFSAALRNQQAMNDEAVAKKDKATKTKEYGAAAQKASEGALKSMFTICMNWNNPQHVLQGIAGLIMGSAQALENTCKQALLAEPDTKAGFTLTPR